MVLTQHHIDIYNMKHRRHPEALICSLCLQRLYRYDPVERKTYYVGYHSYNFKSLVCAPCAAASAEAEHRSISSWVAFHILNLSNNPRTPLSSPRNSLPSKEIYDEILSIDKDIQGRYY